MTNGYKAWQWTPTGMIPSPNGEGWLGTQDTKLARLRAIEAAAREVAAWEPTDLRDNFNTKRYRAEVQALRAALEAKP